LPPTFWLCGRKFAPCASDFRLLRRDQDFCNIPEKRFTLMRLRSQKTGTMSDDMMPDFFSLGEALVGALLHLLRSHFF